jgi:spore germination protein YaaH
VSFDADHGIRTYACVERAPHEAGFENAQSIAAKTGVAKNHGLAGISMWRLGQEDLSFWNAARAGLD